MQKAGRYTCRHDGVASILDFKLKLANRCSKEVKQGQSMHRFLISGPDLRIDAAKKLNLGQSVHRFPISSPDLRIDAAQRSKQGQSVHRFSISSPDLRIDAAKRSKQGQSLQPKGWSNVPRPGNAGWTGTSDGVAARGFVNGRGLPRSGGRESTAGAHRSEVPARRQSRTREHGSARRQTRQREHGPARRQTRLRRQLKPRRQARHGPVRRARRAGRRKGAGVF